MWLSSVLEEAAEKGSKSEADGIMAELHNFLSNRLRFFSNLCSIVLKSEIRQLLTSPPWQKGQFTLSIAVTYCEETG